MASVQSHMARAGSALASLTGYRWLSRLLLAAPNHMQPSPRQQGCSMQKSPCPVMQCFDPPSVCSPLLGHASQSATDAPCLSRPPPGAASPAASKPPDEVHPKQTAAAEDMLQPALHKLARSLGALLCHAQHETGVQLPPEWSCFVALAGRCWLASLQRLIRGCLRVCPTCRLHPAVTARTICCNMQAGGSDLWH